MAIPTIDVDQLKELLEKSPQTTLVDVREKSEFVDFRIGSAKNFPLSSLDPAQILHDLGQNESSTLYIVCRSGARSQKACELFTEIGFKNVCNIRGGTLAWQDRGYPLLRG